MGRLCQRMLKIGPKKKKNQRKKVPHSFYTNTGMETVASQNRGGYEVFHCLGELFGVFLLYSLGSFVCFSHTTC